MRWPIIALALMACRTLAPPPEDLDTYCVGVLAKSNGMVPPECTDTAERIREGRPSESEMAASEKAWRIQHPYEACIRDAARQRNRCLVITDVTTSAQESLETMTGAPFDRHKRDVTRSDCATDYMVDVQICDAQRVETRK